MSKQDQPPIPPVWTERDVLGMPLRSYRRPAESETDVPSRPDVQPVHWKSYFPARVLLPYLGGVLLLLAGACIYEYGFRAPSATYSPSGPTELKLQAPAASADTLIFPDLGQVVIQAGPPPPEEKGPASSVSTTPPPLNWNLLRGSWGSYKPKK
ncbi:MAG: hypothetical protein D6730_23475 [Bacteroidetes bacterium]|nr:MAG: hypothetical protein D6730_23475 [Bacteroidota bacterium]